MKKLIKKILNNIGYDISKIIYPLDKFPVVEAEKKIIEFIEISKNYSMGTKIRMYSLAQAIKKVKIDKLEGDIVECGVWMGGNLILSLLLNDYYGLNKNIYGFDTFDGMTEPSKYDYDLNKNSADLKLQESKKIENIDNIWCYSSIEEVKRNISKNTTSNKYKLIKGPVENTLNIEENLPKKISVLRLDTDFYESTKKELEVLYPRLVKNGILIVDDYGHWQGSRKAVDEYFQNDELLLNYIDYTCRMIIKK
tara:strand:- start:4374 stop:5129 length:756 start_codon:yes stop_codon:yes gene_type:complete